MELNIHTETLAAVFALSVALGALTSRTGFCTMGAVSDWINIGDLGRMRSWMLAIATAMAGLLLEAAALGIPALLDGFIATAAALAARAIKPAAADWWLASHRSQEQGHLRALAALGLTPLIDLELRLGEGSGAALAVPLIQMAVRLHNEMATFAEAGVSGAA